MEKDTCKDGHDHGHHRLHDGKCHEITGTFQLAPAVQHQRTDKRQNADNGTDGHVAPAVFGGDTVDLVVFQLAQCIEYLFIVNDQNIAHGGNIHQGADLYERNFRKSDAMEEGLIDHGYHPVAQRTGKIDHGIQCQLAQTVAGQHDAQHRDTKKEQVLQFGSQQPPEDGNPSVSQPHDGQRDQGDYQIGKQGKGNAGGNVGTEPAFPPQRQGMEGVAHAACKQIAEEQLRHHSTVDQIQPAHQGNAVTHILQPVVGIASVCHADQCQQHQNQAGTPGRCKPGQVFAEYGFVKE